MVVFAFFSAIEIICFDRLFETFGGSGKDITVDSEFDITLPMQSFTITFGEVDGFDKLLYIPFICSRAKR